MVEIEFLHNVLMTDLAITVFSTTLFRSVYTVCTLCCLEEPINGDGQQRAACSMQYSVVQNEESLPHVIISCVVHSEGQKEKVVIHSMKEFCSVLC